MAYDITAANAVFTITVAGLYNAPITLQNFAADQAWDTAAQNCAETEMSVDGYLNTGWRRRVRGCSPLVLSRTRRQRPRPRWQHRQRQLSLPRGLMFTTTTVF